jgi:hypothetical protein
MMEREKSLLRADLQLAGVLLKVQSTFASRAV